ncbi:MAG: hypothetical protein KJ583_01565 [Nanoarchaeota archaeon]|nr:hypothetical protein [Nanoarchaeota archaeon]MBU1270002.1 hypothetical protein [Nanoarchaeota archaeon]MBU1603981.1 hypothetical protein [Nanoarchaeota archaeon]MBU2443686.1 hypothetical protein [Nanoarchaeota archaeon]
MNAAEILTSLAEPEIIKRGLSDDNKWLINMILNERFRQLDEDLGLIYEEIKHKFMKKTDFETLCVKNYKEKLDIILSKHIIPDNVLHKIKCLNPEIADIIKDYRCKQTNKQFDKYTSYRVNLTIMSHAKNKGLEPHLMIKKNSKSLARVASKIPRKIYEESIKRGVIGGRTDYDVKDGLIKDFKGLQLVTLKPYRDDKQILNLQIDPITTLKSYFVNPKTSNIEVVEIVNHYEKLGDYGAIHLKVRYSPIGNAKSIDSGVSEVPKDFIEIQIIDIENFLKKEIGHLNQLNYAFRQASFKDREFLEDMKKLRNQNARVRSLSKKSEKEHKEYINKCKSFLLDVLTHHYE